MQRTPPLTSALLLALVAGGIAGLVVAEWRLGPRLDRLSASLVTTSTPGVPEVTPEPDIEIIPLERRPLASSYPKVFVNRTATGALVLGSAERRVGMAVALTTDGWLLTTEPAVAGMRLADIDVVHEGVVRPIERAIRDRSTGLVYLKMTAQGLPVTTFVRPSDVLPGSAVWIEGQPFALRPESVIEVRIKNADEPVSSERASRQFLVSGPEAGAWVGAPVWDGAGRLLGVLAGWNASENGWRVTPVGSVGRDLGALLSTGEIRRAALGVRAHDLASLVLDTRPATLPLMGAWLRPDRKTGQPAVTATGPSGKQLKEGDVIERIERDILDGAADLGERLLDYRPGATVRVHGERAGAPFTAEITLGDVLMSETIK